MSVRYYDQGINSKLRNKRKLSSFLHGLIKRHLADAKTIDLTYVFCPDAFLADINRKFLNHDTLTDIITFELSEECERITGEIYISVERVAENARKFNVSYEEELHRVIFHGALHLCGFKDKKKQEKAIMRQEEDNCLRTYFEY